MCMSSVWSLNLWWTVLSVLLSRNVFRFHAHPRDKMRRIKARCVVIVRFSVLQWILTHKTLLLIHRHNKQHSIALQTIHGLVNISRPCIQIQTTKMQEVAEVVCDDFVRCIDAKSSWWHIKWQELSNRSSVDRESKRHIVHLYSPRPSCKIGIAMGTARHSFFILQEELRIALWSSRLWLHHQRERDRSRTTRMRTLASSRLTTSS